MGDIFLAPARVQLAVLVLLLALPGVSAAQQRQRNDGSGGDTGSSQAVPRDRAPAPAPAPAQAPEAAAPRQAVPRAVPRAVESESPSSEQPAAGARPRDGRPTVGTAVPRGSVPSPRPDTVIVAPQYYRSYWPWGYGGLGFGSYYGRFYDPYVFYDPFYGYWYPGYGYGGYSRAYSIGPDGSLRLKVKPRDAQVFVDGYYVGIVDEFDGVFQRLHLDVGPHRVEIRAAGYEPLTFDVQIRFDDTTTFEGELTRIR